MLFLFIQEVFSFALGQGSLNFLRNGPHYFSVADSN